MKIGDRVFVTADNYGIGGVIVGQREQEPRWLVRQDNGSERWFFTYEVSSDEQLR